MIENFLLIDDKILYLDIEALNDFIKIKPEEIGSHKRTAKSNKNTSDSSIIINVTKYELVKMMIDVVFNMGFSMQDTTDMDETEKLIKGVNNNELDSMPIPFKIAYNTLIINKILKFYEPTNRKNQSSNSEIKR